MRDEHHSILHAASNLSRWAFLAGSGISVPSGLPSGWEFNTGLIDFLSDNPSDKTELLTMVTSGYEGAGGVTVRFEEVLNVLRDRGDPLLDILRCFDTSGPATELHHFLARAALAGSYVITTNFDSLVELASRRAGHDLAQVFAETAPSVTRNWMSFDEYSANGLPTPAILKLHGTLRSTDGAEQFWSVGATLDRLGQAGPTLRLEPSKHEVLRRTLQGRFLCVIGYSGNDDFDVTPSLADALAGCSGLIWVAHENTAPVIEPWTPDRCGVIPAALHAPLARVPALYVCGRTVDAIWQIFRPSLPTMSPALVTRVPVGERLAGLPIYRSMGRGQKRIIAARIAEKAGRLDYALAAYEEAAALVRRHDPSLATYVLFRIAHIATLRENAPAALLLLQRARASTGFRRDSTNRVHVLNALGNIHLNRGSLGRAERHYRNALDAATQLRNLKLQATILNNLGIIKKKRGEYQEAVTFYDRALELDMEARERIGIARDLSNKAAALLLMERHDEALVAFDEVIVLQRLLGRSELLAVSLANRGVLLRKLGRLAEARAEASLALKIERGLGRREGIARSLSVLASVAAARGRWSRAIMLFAEAISIEEAIGAREGMAFDCESLADCYAAVGDHDAAQVGYERARALFAALGNRSKAAAMRTAGRIQATLRSRRARPMSPAPDRTNNMVV